MEKETKKPVSSNLGSGPLTPSEKGRYTALALGETMQGPVPPGDDKMCQIPLGVVKALMSITIVTIIANLERAVIMPSEEHTVHALHMCIGAARMLLVAQGVHPDEIWGYIQESQGLADIVHGIRQEEEF